MASTPVLVFDGECGFCTSSARWLERHARRPVSVEPWQRLDLGALGLSAPETAAAAWWVDEHGIRHRGHRAVGYALRACAPGWRILGWACLVPPFSWCAAVTYRLVARFRGHLPGRTPACRAGDAGSGAR
jgi:predicted DCC family thiol-disulfide oxidoreductase YuxK